MVKGPLAPQSGFTLLELLISLSIISAIVGIAFSGYRLGIRAWEKGEQDLAMRQQNRIVLELLRRQISAIWVQPNVISEGKVLGLMGDAKSMAFVSQTALTPDNEYGGVYARYEVRGATRESREKAGECLLFSEKSMVFLAASDLAAPSGTGGDRSNASLAFHTLIPVADQIRFDYLKDYSTENFIWQETWNPDADGMFPRAVRISMVMQVHQEPLVVIVRLDAKPENVSSS